jgi:hypothetical protein
VCALHLFGSGERQVAVSYEVSSETVGSTKGGKFFDYLSTLIDSQEALCSMELAG